MLVVSCQRVVAKSGQPLRLLYGRSIRFKDINLYSKLNCSTKPATQQSSVNTNVSSSEQLKSASKYTPNDLERKILVHFKHYPNYESVPDRVNFALVNKAWSQFRIKVSLGMMATALFLCFCTAVYGRSHMHNNQSLVEVNFRRHEAYKRGEDFYGRRVELLKKKEADKDSEQ